MRPKPAPATTVKPTTILENNFYRVVLDVQSGALKSIFDKGLKKELVNSASPYHFIEVMTCPGGCVGGGGQPVRIDQAKRLARNKAMYVEDLRLGLRKSHENPAVQELSKDFLGEPLGHLSHKLLHTKYQRREF